MSIAIDSSVLLAIGKGEADSLRWIDFLAKQTVADRLIVCDIVVAETAALFDQPSDVVPFLHDLNIEFEPTRPESAILAGHIFKAYRRSGGPRHHLIPDFLIGAHAQLQAGQLAAADRGYLRRYFPKLEVVAPP